MVAMYRIRVVDGSWLRRRAEEVGLDLEGREPRFHDPDPILPRSRASWVFTNTSFDSQLLNKAQLGAYIDTVYSQQ